MNRIWIPRCEEIKRIEQKEGIQKIDLRKKRNRIDEDHMTDKDIEKEKSTKIRKNRKNKFNKNINLVTLNRLIGVNYR